MRPRASAPARPSGSSPTCTNGATYPFDIAAGATATTPDIPVGTACTITEDPPAAGGLIDGSFAWGPTPAPQTVTVTSSGQVVAVTMTNTVVRVSGQLTIAKAAITPGDVVDPARQYAVTYSCVYGNDPAGSGHGQRHGRRSGGDGRAAVHRLALHHPRGPGDPRRRAQRHRPVVGVAPARRDAVRQRRHRIVRRHRSR